MNVGDWMLILITAYILIGGLFAWVLSQTPYSDNGFLINLIFWPLYAWAIMRGGL